ncbi:MULTISPECIES: hypothetical protein [Dyella]|uniref:hypothetical protein n=1 Tax=Dyella TaxID=231454 RepID=UPI000C824116|nr:MULTISPECIES: hypothetical protein [Dyella]MDR3448121.1 hypothetical protein [Dyella sp.]PMQ05574.1 hypothetical protein DyAD56_09595 [Dyella sp. AD56]ULU24798.1 hypothetical protein DYST_01718 [Dyella terrae]
MIQLYLSLLLAGAICFVLHFGAQYRVASLLRSRHPNEWKIIAESDGQPTNALRTWMRLQLALRSPVLPALEDGSVTRWRQVWRYSPWAAWLCWFGALAVQYTAR